MKVAYILKYFQKLSETFIQEEIFQLIRNGIDVEICSFLRSNSKIQQHSKAHEILERCHIVHYPLFNPIDFFLNVTRNPLLSVRTPELTLRSRVSRIFDYIKISKPDVIHSHFLWERSEVAAHIGEKLNIPTTITCHAKDIFKPNRRRLKMVAEKSTKIITISNFNKHYLTRLDVPEDRIEVIHCGIDPDMFKPKRREINDEGIAHIATTGRLIEKKGTIYLLKAVKNIISAKKAHIFLHIIGDGPLKTKLEKFVRHNGLQDNVRIYGSLIDVEVKRILDKAHIFVLPCVQASDGDMDGIPISLMEAMAMEKGVVSTNISGIPELISDGVEGLLTEQKDVAGLEEHILELINNPEMRGTLGRNARKKIIKDFNSKKSSAKLLDLWHGLI